MAGQRIVSLTILFTFLFLVAGCGGGGSGGGETLPTKTLSWNPPATYQDGSSLNPSSDLDSYEIYVKETSNFTDTDNEMATLSSIDQATGKVATTFNLANLAPFISRGIAYHVSVRAVAKNGLKSEFSPSATFSF